jgi:hypothetical protein
MTKFERDLHSSPAFRLLCQDDDFAAALYTALENQDWIKDGEVFGCSFRYAGGLVADLRDKNECYLGWYCSKPRDCSYITDEHAIRQDVRDALAGLGWTAS